MELEMDLVEYIQKNKCEGFNPIPHYFKDGDYISVYFTENECYAEQINKNLIIYRSFLTNEITGCAILNVISIVNN